MVGDLLVINHIITSCYDSYHSSNYRNYNDDYCDYWDCNYGHACDFIVIMILLLLQFQVSVFNVSVKEMVRIVIWE